MSFKFYDFSGCSSLIGGYGGSGKKEAIVFEGEAYMVKYGSVASYSVISEFIACHMIKEMGYPVQETLLGERNGYLVVACKDFVPDEKQLIEFYKIENKLFLPSQKDRTPVLANLKKTFQHETFFHSSAFVQEAVEQYWNTFIIDAYIGNSDRNSTKWGYLVKNDSFSDFIENAPIYGCSSSLYSQISDDMISQILKSKGEIQKQIKNPAATLKLDIKQHNIGYKEMITSGYEKCENALLRVAPKISIKKMHEVIDEIPVISESRKQFYKGITDERYKQIILEPYLQLTGEKQIKVPDSIIENEKMLF